MQSLGQIQKAVKKRLGVGGGRRDLQQPLASGIWEKLEGAALVLVRPVSGLGTKTSGSQQVKSTRVKCFWDLQRTEWKYSRKGRDHMIN